MGAIIPKLRASARGQQCHFNIPGICNHDPETTVLCHIRDGEKGIGNKASDYSSAFGCSACHHAIDNHELRHDEEYFFSLRAMQRTIKFWIEHGYLVIPGVLTKQTKPSTKIVQRSPLYARGD